MSSCRPLELDGLCSTATATMMMKQRMERLNVDDV
jgi:hypothetical protein